MPPTPRKDPRPTVANADVPSETAGLPGIGDGASAQGFARDLVGKQANADDQGTGPAGSPRGQADPPS